MYSLLLLMCNPDPMTRSLIYYNCYTTGDLLSFVTVIPYFLTARGVHVTVKPLVLT